MAAMRAMTFCVLGAALTFAYSSPPRQALVEITGRVITISGTDARPVRRATVTLTGTGPARVSQRDVDGVYRFDRLPAGDYKVGVQKAGFVGVETTASSGVTLERAGAIE